MVGGADPHRPSKDGKTPVESAAEEKHWLVVDLVRKTVGPDRCPPIPPEAEAAIASGALQPPPAPQALAASAPSGGPGGAPAAPQFAAPVAPAAPAFSAPGAPAPPELTTQKSGFFSRMLGGDKAKDSAPKPRLIAGLDFGRGVIMEGALYKKRANKILKWRQKYYILSQLYGALFFWTGSKDKVEGVIKKVRFETFLAVRHFNDKQNGKRFDLKVVTGRTMQLLASSTDEAKKWVETLNSVVGKLMATVRIQAAYRGYRARKQLKHIREEREKAVAMITGQSTAGAAGGAGAAAGSAEASKAAAASIGTDVSKASASAVKTKNKGGKGKGGDGDDDDQAGPAGPLAEDGILVESELRKRNHQVMASLVSAYRTRYFVLHRGAGALVYYESKAKRTMGVAPRCIPFLSFYSVVHHLDKKAAKTRAFTLRLLSGKAFVFEARTPEEASQWVAKIESVVPRDHLAAVKVQAWVRRFLVKKLVQRMKKQRADAVAALVDKYSNGGLRSVEQLRAAAIKVCAYLRMHHAVLKYKKLKVATAEARPAGAAITSASFASSASAGAGAHGMCTGGVGEVVAAPVATMSMDAFVNSPVKQQAATSLYGDGMAQGSLLPPPTAASEQQGVASTTLPPPMLPPPATLPMATAAVTGALPLPPPPAPAPSPMAAVTIPASLPPPPAVGAQAAAVGVPGTLPPPPAMASGAGALPLPSVPAVQQQQYAAATMMLPPPPAMPPAPALPVYRPKRRVKPSRWIMRPDASTGRSFYANVDSGATQWDVPAGFSNGTAKVVGQYFSMVDASGRKYYVNSATSGSVWDRPLGYESDAEVEVDDDGSGIGIALPGSLPPTTGVTSAGISVVGGGQPLVVEEDFGSKKPKKKAAAPAELLGEAAAVAARQRQDAGPASMDASAQQGATATAALDRMKRMQQMGAGGKGLPATAAPPPGSASSAAAGAGGAQADAGGLVVDAAEAAEASATVAEQGCRSTHARRSAAHLLAIRHADVATEGVTSCANAGLPSWREYADEACNRPYYYCVKSGESVWVKPGSDGEGVEEDAEPYNPVTDATLADANEQVTFSLWINSLLEADPLVGAAGRASRAPLSLEDDPPAIVSKLKDGLLLCSLVNAVVPGSIDVRALNVTAVPGESKPIKGREAEPEAVYFPARENVRAALLAAQAAAVHLNKDTTAEAVEAGAAPAIMDVVWALMKRAIVSTSLPLTTKGIGKLTIDGETADDLISLPIDKLLLRWLNYQLARAGCGLSGLIDSFGTSLIDGVAICALVRIMCPSLASDIPATDDAVRKAGANDAVTAALSAAFGAGVQPWFTVEGIIEGNARLQMAFVAMVCAAVPGHGLDKAGATPRPPQVPAALESGARLALLPATSRKPHPLAKKVALSTNPTNHAAVEQGIAAACAGASADAEAEQLERDATTVAAWINGLDIEGVAIRSSSANSSFSAACMVKQLRDGVILLKILDAVEPGIVSWARVNLKPSKASRSKQVENCNYVINVGRAMDFGLSNVTGVDIVEGNTSVVVPFLWQLMRYHTMRTVSDNALHGFAADETEILSWANQRVAAEANKAGQPGDQIKIRSFGDSELATGIYLLYLVNSLRPCVNWKHVADGETKEQQGQNAVYVLSLARKLGAVCPSCSLTDIVEVRPRSIMLLAASLLEADARSRKGSGEDGDEEQ